MAATLLRMLAEMYAAVHSDRSGRVFVSADYAAAVRDGAGEAPMAAAIPLPAGAEVLPLADREAVAFDRRGRRRGLGSARWAVGAVLPEGALRTAMPAYEQPGSADPLAPRPYAAVGADESGSLVVAAIPIAARAPAQPVDEARLAARINDALRAHPSNAALRQLARCARHQGCRRAREAFDGRDRVVPVGGVRNESPPPGVALGDEGCRSTGATSVAKPHDLAELALAFLSSDTDALTFGGACDGEPLLAAWALGEAIGTVRRERPDARLELRSNASVPAALSRACAAGVSALRVRLVSARPDTYDWFHGPIGYRWADVQASLRVAGQAGVHVTIEALVLPGLFDLAPETDALIGLVGSLRDGSALRLADLHADPVRASGPRRGRDRPRGVAAAVARIAAELPGLRVASWIA